MRFINVFIIISNLLFITQLYAQIGIGTPTPHKEADIHLANKNRTVILNHVDEKTALKDPQPGMIFYDTQDECFRGYANGEFTDCFGTIKKDPIVTVAGPGFKGNYVRGEALTDASFEVTVTNNTFDPVNMGFNITDLQIDNSDITVTAVYLAGNSNTSTTQFDQTLVTGASKTIVYKLSGTPSAPYTQISGLWSKINLEFQNTVDVKYHLDCNKGSWEVPITPIVLNNLVNGQAYSGVYKLTYDVDATGYVFDAFTQTSNGLTMTAEEVVGGQSGEILIHLSGIYNSPTANNFIFLPPYGCTITFAIPKNCKEIKELLPTAFSGVYEIDVDGDGGLASMDCYCDMETDGGGWTLVLNYNHIGGTNPSLNVMSDKLPLLGSYNLGVDESSVDNKKYWGHFSNSLANKMIFQELRFYGLSNSKRNQFLSPYPKAKGNDGRIIHFKTSLPQAVNYVKTGVGSMNGLKNSYTILESHTANLPASMDNFFSNTGNNALTDFPFYEAGTTHWGVKGSGSRWEVDDYPNGAYFNTYHQVWVR